MRRFANRPGIACSPALGLGHHVAKTRVKNARVLRLEPVIEPGERLDMKTLPRPGEAILTV
jgi:hypothetical protein